MSRATELTGGSAPERAGRSEAAGGPGAGFVSRTWIAVMAVAATLLAAAALYSLWAFWPSAARAGQQAQDPQQVNYFGWRPSLSHEFLFFLVVALAGGLGGLVHTIRSFAWYVGNRQLYWSWIPFNLMLPVVGALGGTVFYLVLRAGLFSPSASTDETSPFGFAAVSVLVGLFSEQALEKLKQVATNLFAERPKGADHVEPGTKPEHAPQGTGSAER